MSGVRRWARRHERTTAALGYLGVLLLWFWPLLKGWQMGQSHVLWLSHPWAASKPPGLDLPAFSGEGDASNVFHPILTLAREQLGRGELPLWNPHIYGGMALMGDIQSALFHPLTWIGLVLGPEAGWGWMCVGKLLVAALGARELGRRVGLSACAAWLAGLVFCLSAPLLAWLQWPLTTVFAMFGWLLWATHGAVVSPGRRSLAALGIVVGISLLAGHPETAFLSTAAAGVYGLVLAVGRRGERRPVPAALAWAGGHVLGVALAAVALVPFARAYHDSLTQAVHGEQADIHLPVRAVLTWFVPGIFGDGRPEYRGPLGTWVITAASVGSVTLLLAAVAVWRRRAARGPGAALAVMSALALAVVFGLPPVSFITRSVPPFATGNNVRILYVPAVALALGAGMGLDELARRALAWRGVALAVGGLVGATAVLLVVAQAFGALPGPRSVTREATGRAVLFAVLGGVCLAALGSSRRRGLALALVVVVALLDLAAARPFNAVLPPEQAYVTAPPAVRFLQRQAAPRRLSTVRPGPFPPYVLPPDTNDLYGLDTIQGYDYPESHRWADFSWFVLGERGVQREIILTSPQPRGPALPALRLMATGWYMGAPGAPRPGPALRLAYDGPDARIWRDPGALPRAYVLGGVRPLSDAAALATLRRGGLDPRREALVPADAVPPHGAGGRFRAARAREVSSQEWRVDVGRGPAGWLVLANAYSPEWRAEVDGRDVAVRPTNFAAMGVPLGPGAHRVRFTLRHGPFWAGAAVSLLALLACVVLLVLPARRGTLGA